MKKARFAVVAATVFALLLVGRAPVYAASQPTGQGNGLKIAPVRTDLTIEKGGSRQVQVYVENITAFPMKVVGIINDFVASNDETGEPRIILDPNQSAPGNSFKTLIKSVPTITLQPNERKQVNLTLSVPQNAASGGYYGAVRFAPDDGAGNKNVSLTASVGTIFLITVPGNITEQLKVESFDVTHAGSGSGIFNSGPIQVVTRFRNFGNIHVEPFGKISIKNSSGKTLSTVEINNTDPRGAVLPNSTRKFVVTTDGTKDANGKDIPLLAHAKFGRYIIEGSFGYGSNGDLILARKTIYIIPYKFIAAAILLLAFLIFVLPRLIRAYNRRIIRRSQGAAAAKSKVKTRTKPKKK